VRAPSASGYTASGAGAVQLRVPYRLRAAPRAPGPPPGDHLSLIQAGSRWRIGASLALTALPLTEVRTLAKEP
jgi:hypothetical protein